MSYFRGFLLCTLLLTTVLAFVGIHEEQKYTHKLVTDAVELHSYLHPPSNSESAQDVHINDKNALLPIAKNIQDIQSNIYGLNNTYWVKFYQIIKQPKEFIRKILTR